MSLTRGAPQGGGGGATREEMKVFQSTLDKITVQTTVFGQPSLYMGLANLLVMLFIQRMPSDFLSPKYLTMSYNGIKASSLLGFPFCFISGAYLAVASLITTGATPLAGHFWGYGLSLTTGLTFMTFRRVSWYYPLLGVMYLTFGGWHHYRRMMVFGDNAPVFNWSDFGLIYRDWRLQRTLRRDKKKALQAAKRSIA